MSETIRIRTTPNGSDKYLKVKIDQEFDFIEVLSMKITQEEAYRNFCSDYGVIVGRVIINSGFGLPNARVSVFLPIDDEDKNDTVIKGLYPYSIVSDKDSDGIRYNLLPKSSETNNECFTPIGTFPNKREILDNEELLNVYCKYYKFTTTTNSAGDFMIFGVPLGTYVIHVDADISDIGIASQRPYDLISQGTPVKFFESATKFKGGSNLDKLVQVKSTNYSVNVQPFWGEAETCEIGISRTDIDMNYNIIPSAMFMGSIFGDQDKNSINKRCRPRKDLGELCSQVAGEGTIEMIRETIDGGVEQFDIDGGQLIDADGTWAYQIPMNLDYVITDENGNLIPSDDPNKGIPTRASVRFKIGMENTGGEGRLRTRAKYLVPNNPQTSNEIDYKFDSTTKKTSFRSLYWNKIYTVSNYIPRFQKNSLTSIIAAGLVAGPLGAVAVAATATLTPPLVSDSQFIGVKNVDNCAGDKNPFPFNKVSTEMSPIFFIMCILIKIVGFLIYVMNALIIPIINVLIKIVNFIIGAIRSLFQSLCDLSNWSVDIAGLYTFSPFGAFKFACPIAASLKDVEYIKCLYTECPNDSGTYFAPGCKKSSEGWIALNKVNNAPAYYPGDNFGHPEKFGDLAGLDNCLAFEMAKNMNLFQFDFYNDWVNGSLFGFLLKYKKKKRKRELFCEYDCNPEFFGQGGVDGNKNGVGDNNCYSNYLTDSCYPIGNNSQKSFKYTSLREGLIKKIDTYVDGKKVSEEFLYAATKHDASFKLFATEIICLGSVFDCDWQGIPKIQSLLIPSSYKLPPDIQELTDAGTTETTGQCGLDGNIKGLFFEVDCIGIHSDSRQVLNIRHLCEMGVDLDELDYDLSGNPISPDSIVGKNEINENGGKWFRDVIYDLNKDLPNSVTSFNHGGIFTTEFNTKNQAIYPFAIVGSSQNGNNYIKFRGYQGGSDSSYGQPKNSYFFYFGILPGKTGLDKLNQRFFTKCIPVVDKEFNITASSIPSQNTNPNGSITFTVVSGTAPFTYTVSGPNGVSNGTLQIDPATGQPIPVIINGPQGQYSIEVIDANGNIVTQNINVDGPPPFYGAAGVTKMCTSASAVDGEITISSIGGGSGVWTYKLYKSDGSVIKNTTSITTIPLIIGGLPADTASNGATPAAFGYKLVLSDGVTSITITDLKIDGPTPVVISLDKLKKTTCWESQDGEYKLNITGGKTPYTINVTGVGGYTNITTTANSLFRGPYQVTVVDAYNTSAAFNFNIDSNNPQMIAVKAASSDLAKQCDPNSYYIPFLVQTGEPIPAGSSAPLKIGVQYNVNETFNSNGQLAYNDLLSTTNYVNGSTYVYVTIPNSLTTNKDLRLRFKSVDGLCFSNVLTMNEPSIRLPNTTLGINFNGINNAKQCNPNVVTFKFNVSHWLVGGAGYMERAPYTFKYKINGSGPTGTNSFFTKTITSNQQVINTTMPAVSSSAAITYTITDNKGCTASGSFTITMPAQALVGQVVRTNTSVPLPLVCQYSFTASGGIGGKTSTRPLNIVNNSYIGPIASAGIANAVRPTFCSVYPNPVLVATITDSVGCSVIKST